MVYSHETAFELLRYFRFKQIDPQRHVKFNQCSKKIRSNPAITQAFGPDKVHFIAHDKSRTFSTLHFLGHFFNSKKLEVTCTEYTDGTILLPPEMILLQAAGNLTYAQVYCLIQEFCGTYSLCPERFRQERTGLDSSDNIKYGISPACSIDSISKFIKKKTEARCRIAGTRKVKSLLPFCGDGAASPQEAQIYGKLCLSAEFGGLGIRGIRLNFPIDIGLSVDEEFASTVVADFCIPEKKLVIEYDSDEFHSDTGKIQRDKARRDALELAGWNCYTLTSQQVRTQEIFNEKILGICKRHKIEWCFSLEYYENQRRLFYTFKRI